MRLIDADKLPVVTEWCVDEAGFGASFHVVHEEDINKAPTIDPESLRPQGEWIDNHCTACGMTPLGEELWEHLDVEPPKFEWCMDYCPHCGAKMKGAGENA